MISINKSILSVEALLSNAFILHETREKDWRRSFQESAPIFCSLKRKSEFDAVRGGVFVGGTAVVIVRG